MTSALTEARQAAYGPAFVALVVGAVAMGASPTFVRLADVGPFTSAFWRVALALPILYAWMRFAERDGAPRPILPRRAIAATAGPPTAARIAERVVSRESARSNGSGSPAIGAG